MGAQAGATPSSASAVGMALASPFSASNAQAATPAQQPVMAPQTNQNTGIVGNVGAGFGGMNSQSMQNQSAQANNPYQPPMQAFQNAQGSPFQMPQDSFNSENWGFISQQPQQPTQQPAPPSQYQGIGAFLNPTVFQRLMDFRNQQDQAARGAADQASQAQSDQMARDRAGFYSWGGKAGF